MSGEKGKSGRFSSPKGRTGWPAYAYDYFKGP